MSNISFMGKDLTDPKIQDNIIHHVMNGYKAKIKSGEMTPQEVFSEIASKERHYHDVYGPGFYEKMVSAYNAYRREENIKEKMGDLKTPLTLASVGIGAYMLLKE